MWDFERLREEQKESRRFLLSCLVLVGLVSALLVTGGCDLAEKLQGFKQNRAPAQSEENLPDLFPEDIGTLAEEPEKTSVSLYFKDEEGRYLVRETQEIVKVPGIARATLQALCEGPAGTALKPSLPAGTELRELNIRPDGTCIVDLSRAVTEIPGQDPKAEALAVYAVVNTLTEFPTVERVKILVEGQLRETLAGHIPIDEPLLRNLTFVKNS
ncbi:MAG: GerMN domain-containing protein [Bacillota bacterium]|nr:GerMN domain-containing protein [Bacillota bacterium]